MKSPKNTLLVAIGFVAMTSLAKADLATNIYFTDFYTNNSGLLYTADAPIVGQDGWYTTSVNNPGPGAVRYLNANAGTGYQPDSFVLGGTPYASVISNDQNTYPTTNETTILRGVPVNFNSIYFDSTFTIASGSGARDSFGWTVLNSEGFYLMQIKLKATTTTNGSVIYNIGATSFANDSNLEFQPLLKNGAPVTPLNPNDWYRIGFDIYDIGTANQSIGLWTYNLSGTNTTTPTLVSRTDIAGYDFSDDGQGYNNGNTNIGTIGMTWFLSDSSNETGTNGNTIYTGFGNNTMIVQTLGVAVPEPQTWVLLGLSGLIAVVAIRRRANS